jgi:hypothetical protein
MMAIEIRVQHGIAHIRVQHGIAHCLVFQKKSRIKVDNIEDDFFGHVTYFS